MDLIDRDELELDTEWSDYYDGFTSYSQSQINGAVEVQAIPIPENATNGNMIQAMFPNLRVEDNDGSIYLHYPDGGWIVFDREWWYAKYSEVEK